MRCHGHQNLIPNISVYASLINIHPLLQKVVCRQFNSVNSKGNYNLDTKCVGVTLTFSKRSPSDRLYQEFFNSDNCFRG